MTQTKIVWAGDSTVARNRFMTWPQTGMGQGLELYLRDGIEVVNLAMNGRSTKSFIDEQRLMTAYFALAKNDLFLISFGHNDGKIDDPSRYTDPESTYPENLKKMINAARNREALPVLLTPLSRRRFTEEGRQEKTHGPYPDVVKEVGRAQAVPVIDLEQLSREFLQELGPEKSFPLFMHVPPGIYPHYPNGLEDNTHLTWEGARQFAGLIARSLYELGNPYHDVLLEEVATLVG